MTIACEVFAALFFILLPIASFIVAFCIFCELKTFRKVVETTLALNSIKLNNISKRMDWLVDDRQDKKEISYKEL